LIVRRTRVKICGITRTDDGIAAVRAGADAIGFVFWSGTPRNITAERAAAIAAAIPPFVSMVGLFVDPDAAHVRSILAAVPLAMLQFHGREPAEFCGSFGRPYLKAVPVDPYSGWPLMFRNEVSTYAVYSLGPNRRDDNADFTLLRFVDGGRQSRDIGVRIQYR